jgi:hypothetical protein
VKAGNARWIHVQEAWPGIESVSLRAAVQIAVRLRRKAGDDRLAPAGIDIGAHDVANEVLAGFFGRGFDNRHDAIVPSLDSKGQVATAPD